VYVYGVAPAGISAARRGVGNAPVTTIEHGALAAIVSSIGDVHVRAKRRDLLRHSDVLQEVFATTPVVPLRFGTVLDSEAAVVDTLLTARYDELVGLVRDVHGLAEYRVRASLVERDVLREIVQSDVRVRALRAAANGARSDDPRLVPLGEAVAAAVAARRVRAARKLVNVLSEVALQLDCVEPQGELEVLRASFLVERRRGRDFEREAERLAARREHVMLELIGPMPPHSFVALDPVRKV
jgi:hypothetical protein